MVFIHAIISILKLYEKKISAYTWSEISKNQYFMVMITQNDLNEVLQEVRHLVNATKCKSEDLSYKTVYNKSKNFNVVQLGRIFENLINSERFIKEIEDDNNIVVYKYIDLLSSSISLYLPYYFKKGLRMRLLTKFKDDVSKELKNEFYITNICFVNIEDEIKNGSLKLVNECNSNSVSNPSESFILIKRFSTVEKYLSIEDLLEHAKNPKKYFKNKHGDDYDDLLTDYEDYCKDYYNDLEVYLNNNDDDIDSDLYWDSSEGDSDSIKDLNVGSKDSESDQHHFDKDSNSGIDQDFDWDSSEGDSDSIEDPNVGSKDSEFDQHYFGKDSNSDVDQDFDWDSSDGDSNKDL